MALRRAAIALTDSGSLMLASRRPQGAGLAQAGTLQLQQQRTHMSVDVLNGNVDRAWRTLSRKLNEENYLAAAKDREYFVKPSQRRRQAAAEARKRFRKQEFSDMLQWIMRRRAGGF